MVAVLLELANPLNIYLFTIIYSGQLDVVIAHSKQTNESFGMQSVHFFNGWT